MFGISFPEFLVVIILLLLVTNPKDIPAIARYLTKIFLKAKAIILSAKQEIYRTSNELGFGDIKNEVEKEIKKEQEELKKTTIIDLYGNEHEVYEVEKIRGDLAKDDLQKEIEEQNKINKKKNSKKKQSNISKTEKSEKN